MPLRKAPEFNAEVKRLLEEVGWKAFVFATKGKSEPDLVSIKGNEALIIETKSEAESKTKGCLNTYPESKINPLRESCNRLYKQEKKKKAFPLWIIHILGQSIWYVKHQETWNLEKEGYSTVYDKGVGCFEKDGVRYRHFPALAFPSGEKKNVEEALNYINKILDEKKGYKIEWEYHDLPNHYISLIIINKEAVERLDEIIDSIASYKLS